MAKNNRMKVALITGSTSGIGLQIGQDLIKKGCFVYFNGRHNFKTPKNSKFIKADLSYLDSIELFNSIKSLDYLILNVGITDRTPFSNIAFEEWNKVFQTNLTIPLFLVQALKDKINENGRIIFISSISGIVPDSVSISYGVSKAAINMLVPYLAKEFASKKITVNAIAPGYTETPWHQNKPKDQKKRIADKCLAKRFGSVKEISQAVQMIIENSFIDGQVIRVDGGFGLV